MTDRAEGRRVFVTLRVVSCGGDQRWRTKLHLGSGEPLDDHHRSSTLGAEPKIARGREDNDRIGVGGSYRLTKRFRIDGEVSDGHLGPGGRSALAFSIPSGPVFI